MPRSAQQRNGYYLINDDIYVDTPAGGTGVTGLSLMDINRDARAWAREYE